MTGVIDRRAALADHLHYNPSFEPGDDDLDNDQDIDVEKQHDIIVSESSLSDEFTFISGATNSPDPDFTFEHAQTLARIKKKKRGKKNHDDDERTCCSKRCIIDIVIILCLSLCSFFFS
eukprot:m.10685 g.10685  ORF g.10685 m.10685 type:complete len:119 (+) comp4305_c0_seq1:192-548(+)